MVMMVFHEPSSPRIEDVNTLWSGFFSSVTSLNLEGVCGLGTGPFVSHVRIFTLETIWPRIPEFFKMNRVTSAFPTRPIYVRQRTTLEDPSEEV